MDFRLDLLWAEGDALEFNRVILDGLFIKYLLLLQIVLLELFLVSLGGPELVQLALLL